MDRVRLFSLLTLLSITPLACAHPPTQNLLLVSVDTTRADRLTPYGYSLPTSPNIEDLARHGAVFLNAYTHAPTTLPAHSSLLTGLLPPAHGVRANGRFRLDPVHLTLAEILRSHGFQTAAVVGAMPLDQRFGLDQGFDTYDGDFGGRLEARGDWLGHPFSVLERRAEDVTDRALTWLEGRREPWFLFVHYFDPHRPHRAPEPYSTQFEDPYDAEIAYTDSQIGRLLSAVERQPGSTLIVLTADHGEGLGEHGEEAHNRYLYNSTVRVPLVFALAGRIAAGGRLDSTVSHVDILPTILELLGIEAPPTLAGRSLATTLVGGEPTPERPVYNETLEWALNIDQGIRVRAMVSGHYKIVRSDVEKENDSFSVLELYDLKEDPHERRNLALLQPDLRSALAERLDQWSRDLEASAFEAERYEASDSMLEGLRSLGYVE